MNRPIPVTKISIYSLAIPMRRVFSHAAARRVCAEPIIVEVELADRTLGYGETHPRPYVTGETHHDVIQSIREVFVPRLVAIRPSNFGEAIEAAAELPLRDPKGRVITAARAAVELALLDAYSRAYHRSMESVAGFLEETWLGSPGSQHQVRFGIVISGMEPERISAFLRKSRLSCIRHYKLKVGDANDQLRLEATLRLLRRGLDRRQTTLVLDANGSWTLEQATAKLRQWQGLPLMCVEQPLHKDAGQDWAILAQQTTLPLMADESLVTPEDAEGLAENRGASWFNIRISKNGGLIPALRLATIAHRHHIQYQLGCMVGETSILSAAARHFLQWVPHVRQAEGNYGRVLLADDITPKSLRFSLAGRWKPLKGPGLGVEVDPDRLLKLAVTPPIEIPF